MPRFDRLELDASQSKPGDGDRRDDLLRDLLELTLLPRLRRLELAALATVQLDPEALATVLEARLSCGLELAVITCEGGSKWKSLSPTLEQRIQSLQDAGVLQLLLLEEEDSESSDD